MRAQTAQELFKQTADEWLDDARHTAQKLLTNRYEITIEDVLLVCPFPLYLKKNLLGQVFKSEIFKPIGYTKSKRPLSHHHVIRIWSLKEEYFPQSVLEHRRRFLEDMSQ